MFSVCPSRGGRLELVPDDLWFQVHSLVSGPRSFPGGGVYSSLWSHVIYYGRRGGYSCPGTGWGRGQGIPCPSPSQVPGQGTPPTPWAGPAQRYPPLPRQEWGGVLPSSQTSHAMDMVRIL